MKTETDVLRDDLIVWMKKVYALHDQSRCNGQHPKLDALMNVVQTVEGLL